MAHNKHLCRLHGVNNSDDECYTQESDIYAELHIWGELGKFRGKNIVCPCDLDIEDDLYSFTIEFSKPMNLTYNTVVKEVPKKQTLWTFDDGPLREGSIEVTLEGIEEMLKDKLTCNFIKVLVRNAEAWGIKSVTASGYNAETFTGVSFLDVDYSKYDICITNPPFSLYKPFLKKIIGTVDYLLIAPILNRTYVLEGIPLMLGQTYIGFNAGKHHDLAFKFTGRDGQPYKSVACDWITSWSEAQLERNELRRNFNAEVKFEDNEYETMPNMLMKDGTYPIRAVKENFPGNYEGWVFVPANMLHFLPLDKYEFYHLKAHNFFNKQRPDLSPFAVKATQKMRIREDGSENFAGYVVRKIKKEVQ